MFLNEENTKTSCLLAIMQENTGVLFYVLFKFTTLLIEFYLLCSGTFVEQPSGSGSRVVKRPVLYNSLL